MLDIDPIDRTVGDRLREARIASRLSQSDVAKALGLTFQQIQKYEKGINRCAPSRLSRIAALTGRPIEWFYSQEATPLPKEKVDVELIVALRRLPNHVRKSMRDLIVTLAEDYDAAA